MPKLRKSPKRQSPKRQSPKRKSPKRQSPKRLSKVDKELNEKLKLFYDVTKKVLSYGNESLLLDHKKKRLCGMLSKEELVKMPWMFNLNLNFDIVHEPYLFEIVFKKKEDKIEKFLTIKNISYLTNNQRLELQY